LDLNILKAGVKGAHLSSRGNDINEVWVYNVKF
jgi:hypothetical protein